MGPEQTEAIPDQEVYAVHWAVFLPTLCIAVVYGCLWMWFTEVHGPSGGVSRASLIVLTVGVPLLLVHAAIRYRNGNMVLNDEELVASPGWPVRRERHVAYAHIAEIKLRRGLIGRLLDVGSLVIIDRNGDRTVMPDLARPEDARVALDLRISG